MAPSLGKKRKTIELDVPYVSALQRERARSHSKAMLTGAAGSHSVDWHRYESQNVVSRRWAQVIYNAVKPKHQKSCLIKVLYNC